MNSWYALELEVRHHRREVVEQVRRSRWKGRGRQGTVPPTAPDRTAR